MTPAAVYTGFEVEDYTESACAPWNDYATLIARVSAVDAIAPKSMAYWFSSFTAASTVGLGGDVDIDLSNINTGNLSSVSYLFAGAGVSSVSLSGWDVSTVQDFSYAFASMQESGLSIDLSNWDATGAVTTQSMFAGSTVQTLSLSGFATSKNLKDASYMFANASQLESLDLAAFDTTGVIMGDVAGMYSNGMQGVFDGMYSLNTVTLGTSFSFKGSADAGNYGSCELPTPLVEDTDGNQYQGVWVEQGGTAAYTSANLAQLYDGVNGPNAITYEAKLGYLLTLDANGRNFGMDAEGKAIDVLGAAKAVDTMTAPPAFSFDTDVSGFSYDSIPSGLIGWSVTPGATVPDEGLEGEIASFTPGVKKTPITLYAVWEESVWALVLDNTAGANTQFAGSYPLVFVRSAEQPAAYAGLDVLDAYQDVELLDFDLTNSVPWQQGGSAWGVYDISSVTVVDSMTPENTKHWFYGLSGATSFDLRKMDTSRVENMDYMFYLCSSAVSIQLPEGFGASATSLRYTFAYCTSLEYLSDVSQLGAAGVDVFDSLFADCYKLAELDLSGFTVNSGAYMGDAFQAVQSLERITLGEGWQWVNGEGLLPDQAYWGIPKADGKWYRIGEDTGYTPEELAEQYSGATWAGTYAPYPYGQAYAIYDAEAKNEYDESTPTLYRSALAGRGLLPRRWHEHPRHRGIHGRRNPEFVDGRRRLERSRAFRHRAGEGARRGCPRHP